MIYFEIVFGLFIVIFSIWIISQLVSAIAGAPAVAADRKLIEAALRAAELKKDDLVVDLGCGDGRALIIATQKFEARGVGVEISPYSFIKAKFNVRRAGLSRKIKIVFGDFKKIEANLKKADLVYLYLFPGLMAKIEPWLFENIAAETRIVSLGFQFSSHKPKSIENIKTPNRTTKIYFY